jgi:hypothetical protein
MVQLAPTLLAVFSIGIFLAHALEAFADMKTRRRQKPSPPGWTAGPTLASNR